MKQVRGVPNLSIAFRRSKPSGSSRISSFSWRQPGIKIPEDRVSQKVRRILTLVLRPAAEGMRPGHRATSGMPVSTLLRPHSGSPWSRLHRVVRNVADYNVEAARTSGPASFRRACMNSSEACGIVGCQRRTVWRTADGYQEDA